MALNFGDLLTDLKERHAVDLIFGFFSQPLLSGLVHHVARLVHCVLHWLWKPWCLQPRHTRLLPARATNSSANTNGSGYQTYRQAISDFSRIGLLFPQVQVSTLDKTVSIQILTCNDPDSKAINVVNSTTPAGQAAMTVQSEGVQAIPTKSEMGCLVLLSDHQKGQSGRLRLTFSETGDFANGETIYVSTDAYGTVYLDKVTFASSTSVQTYYKPWAITHRMSGNYTGSLELYIAMNDFEVVSYLAYNSYTGWMAYSDIGGLLMFAYVMHAFLMLVIGTFIANDSRVLGGARGSYNTVA